MIMENNLKNSRSIKHDKTLFADQRRAGGDQRRVATRTACSPPQCRASSPRSRRDGSVRGWTAFPEVGVGSLPPLDAS